MVADLSNKSLTAHLASGRLTSLLSSVAGAQPTGV